MFAPTPTSAYNLGRFRTLMRSKSGGESRYLSNQNYQIKYMGFSDREGGKYITILGGKFCIRVPQETPGAVARVNKLGKTVYEVFHDAFTGKLIGIRTKDSEYGKNWEFDFQDGGEVYTLQLSYSNSYATNLLKILPNANLEKEMKIQPSQKVEDGKTKSSLFVSQDGVTLKHAYTKDNPNGMPDMEKILVKGQETWDDSKRLVFLQAMVERDILPKLPKATTPVASAEPMSVAEPVDGEDDPDDY